MLEPSKSVFLLPRFEQHLYSYKVEAKKLLPREKENNIHKNKEATNHRFDNSQLLTEKYKKRNREQKHAFNTFQQFQHNEDMYIILYD